MKIKIQYITNTGLVRNLNEDSILINDILESQKNMQVAEEIEIENKKILCVVADGMGGYSMGEVASKFVLSKFKKAIDLINDKKTLKAEIIQIKKDLDNFVLDNSVYIGMGTVIAGILIIDNKLIVFNIGDSRVYENNFGYCEQLTKDHSLVYSLYASGEIEYDDIQKHPKKNIVTSAMIADINQEITEIYIKEFDICNNKELLICSDGIWESMSIKEMEECFHSKNVVEHLKLKTIQFGANDNFSAIFLRVEL